MLEVCKRCSFNSDRCSGMPSSWPVLSVYSLQGSFPLDSSDLPWSLSVWGVAFEHGLVWGCGRDLGSGGATSRMRRLKKDSCTPSSTDVPGDHFSLCKLPNKLVKAYLGRRFEKHGMIQFWQCMRIGWKRMDVLFPLGLELCCCLLWNDRIRRTTVTGIISNTCVPGIVLSTCLRWAFWKH